MTVSSTTRSVSFSCNGSTHEFDFPFKIFEEGDIRVFIRDFDGVETELTYTTNFEVSNDAGNFNAGGTVTTVSYATGVRATYAWASGNTLIIMRDLDRTQETDYVQNTKINMDTMENDLDRAMMIMQEIDEVLLRALVGPIGDGAGLSLTLPLAAVRANMLLGFNANGEPIAVAGTSDVLVSSFMSGFLALSSDAEILEFLGLDPALSDLEFGTVGDVLRAAESAAEGLAALGVSAFMQTVLDDADQATALATLGAQASDAKLTALAGLSWAADKIILLTAAGTASVIPCTAFARTLLDDATAAAARATLGVATLSDASAGNYLEHSIGDCGGGVQTEASYLKVSEFYLTRGGTYRVVFTLASGDGANVNGRIYRNGSAVGTERATFGATYSEDISGWSAGDLCQLYLKGNTAAATGSAFKVCSAAPMNSAIRQIANVSS